jgi:hypothetical protein
MIPGARATRWVLASWLSSLWGSACGGSLPTLKPLGPVDHARTLALCPHVFPRAPWQATQVIEAQMPLGHGGSFLGAIRAEPGLADFRMLLMTQEGFVLFDAHYRRGRIRVFRAVPPLDSEEFGRGMAADVRLLLFPPAGSPSLVGLSPEGYPTCRYRDHRQVVDVELTGREQARLSRFEEETLARVATMSAIDQRGFAHEAWLESQGTVGYRLHLTLLQVEPGARPAR